MKIIQKFKRLRDDVYNQGGGDTRGFCAHCGKVWISWNKRGVESKDIWYCSHRGMFPLCTNCFNELSIEEIDKYIKLLVFSWLSENEGLEGFTQNTPPWDNPIEIILAAQKEARRLKGVE